MRFSVRYFVLLRSNTFAIAQSSQLDDLKEKVTNAKNDTSRVNALYALSHFYWNRSSDSSILYADQALALAHEHDFKKGVALSYLSKGVALLGKGKYPEALACHLEALKISEELNLKGLSGNNYNNIAIVYSFMGNYPKAIEYFEKSLEIAKAYGKPGTLYALNNLADAYKESHKYEKALNLGKQALALSVEIKDSAAMAIILFNMSENLVKMGHQETALVHLQESLNVSTMIGDIEGISYCYDLLATISLNKRKYDKAILFAEKSVQNIASTGNREILLKSYHTLYKAHEGKRDLGKALYYRNKEIALKEEMFSIEKEREANNLQSEYDLAQKQHVIELLEKDKIHQEKEIVREKFRKWTYIIGIVALVGITAYLVSLNRRWKKFNALLKERNAIIIGQKEKIDEQNTHLEKVNAVKNRLLSIISHDFRSPLHSLQSMVGLMSVGALTSEDIRTISKQMDEKLHVTTQLVENILYWAKSQIEGAGLQPSYFNIDDIIKENLRLARGIADAKQVSLCAIHTGAEVFADRPTIDIVLRNLLNNAIKFSRPGDRISISAHQEKEHVCIAVQDSGVGIPTEKQPTLFENVAGFSTPGTSNEKGTGLGLPLCKEFVELNHGSIWFKSEPDKGTTFMFTVPRSRPEDKV